MYQHAKGANHNINYTNIMTKEINTQKETASNALELYKMNEDNNFHSENYMLLAEFYEDESAMKKASANLSYQELNGYADAGLSKAAHDACNDYYYKLEREAKGITHIDELRAKISDVYKDDQMILDEIVFSQVYTKLMGESFGGVMYNVGDQEEYEKEASEILEKWNKLPQSFRDASGGIVKGAMNFLSGK